MEGREGEREREGEGEGEREREREERRGEQATHRRRWGRLFVFPNLDKPVRETLVVRRTAEGGKENSYCIITFDI